MRLLQIIYRASAVLPTLFSFFECATVVESWVLSRTNVQTSPRVWGKDEGREAENAGSTLTSSQG